jgi:pimeloyl-ACP methyl ester carboxylesterase
MQSEHFNETYWTGPDGLRLYARIYENRQNDAGTVLCLAGLTRNSRDFEDLAPHLQERFRVIVPDLRGRGLSAWDPNPQNYQPSVYIQDILALLDAVAAPQVTVIGTSLGGLLAMMMGAAYRGRIAGIVLNDIGPEADPAGIERIKGYAGRLPPPKDWSDAIAQTRSMFADAWPNFDTDRWSTIVRRGYREDASGAIRVDADPMIGEMLRAAPVATATLWPFWSVLRGIPMLAIRGERSDILSAAVFARMKAENPDLMQLEVAQRGHVPLLDEPECIAAIDTFLARLY